MGFKLEGENMVREPPLKAELINYAHIHKHVSPILEFDEELKIIEKKLDLNIFLRLEGLHPQWPKRSLFRVREATLGAQPCLPLKGCWLSSFNSPVPERTWVGRDQAWP